MYTVVIILPGLSLPPTMMMSPPSRLTAAAWKLVFGSVPLVIVSHESVLGKYLWTALEGSLLSSFPPMASRFPPCSAGVEKKSGQLRYSHFGDEVAALQDSGWSVSVGRREGMDTKQTCRLGKPPMSLFSIQFDVEVFLGIMARPPCTSDLLRWPGYAVFVLSLIEPWEIVQSDMHTSISPA